MPYYPITARKPKRKPKGKKTYKSKALTRAVTKVHHKLEPTKEIRFNNNLTLTSQAAVNFGFFNVGLSDYFAQGTDLNQKASDKIYVSGLQVTMNLSNFDFNQSKTCRFMVVQNKNPADVLDTINYSDLFEGANFAPYVPTGNMKDLVQPINTDILRVIFDKRWVAPPKDRLSPIIKFWVPIKRTWTYKTVANQLNVSNGKTYVVIQAVDATNGALPVSTLEVSWFGRLFYKNA